MTQPSLTTTFDTSLIDLAADQSFSTTESLPSEKDLKLESRRFEEREAASSAIETDNGKAPLIIVVIEDQCHESIPQFLSAAQQRKCENHLRIATLDQEKEDSSRKHLTQWLPELASVITIQRELNISQAQTSSSKPGFDGVFAVFKPNELPLNTYFGALKSYIHANGVVLLSLPLEESPESSCLSIGKVEQKQKGVTLEDIITQEIKDAIEMVGFQFFKNDSHN
jgi:hypothetical protein